MADRIRASFVVGEADAWEPVVAALNDRRDFDAKLTTTVDELAADGVSCVVVDHDPPAIDGIQCVHLLAHYAPSVPVVVHPTAGSETLAGAAIAAGADGYLPQVDGPMVEALANRIRIVCSGPTPTSSLDTDDDSIDAEAMMTSLFDTIPRWVSIFFKDRKGRHLAVNEHRSALLVETPRIETPDGAVLHTREDILGKTDFDLYPTENALETRRDERRIVRTEEPVIDKLEHVVDATGRDVYHSVTKAPWYDESGTVRGIVGVAVDVSDRIHREQALERQNERLERFAAVLSHDLRNPLNVASGSIRHVRDLLGEEPTGVEVDGGRSTRSSRDASLEVLGKADDALERMDQLIDEVLTLAREGRIVSDPEPCSLQDVAADAWESISTTTATCETVGSPGRIVADPERLRTALENLFRNALEHGGEGVTVRIGPLSDGFYFEDDGPGIPEADRDTIFEYGYSTEAAGTGFGLAIVEEIASAHGWSIDVTAAETGGARFEFRGVATLDA